MKNLYRIYYILKSCLFCVLEWTICLKSGCITVQRKKKNNTYQPVSFSFAIYKVIFYCTFIDEI